MYLTILTTVLSIITVITTTVYFYCKYKLNYWKRRGIQQLRKPNLLFGHFDNAILFKSPPGFYLGQLYKKTELPYVGFYIFHKPILLVRDPEIIKQILIKDFHNFSDRNFGGSLQKDSIGMKNLFGLNNPEWKYLRSKITPTLTRLKLKQMFALMMKTGEPMLQYIKMQDTHDGVRVSEDNKYSRTRMIRHHKRGATSICLVEMANNSSCYILCCCCCFLRMSHLVCWPCSL